MHVIRAGGLPVSRWPNGAGRKADIASGDGWMVGYAWLDGDAPFSGLPGLDRTITLVEGPGFTLDIAGRPPLVVDQPFQPAGFDGGAPTTCQVRGPCRVLNVMTERGRLRYTVEIVEGVVAARDGETFTVVLRGEAVVAGVRLERLDAVQGIGESVIGDPGAILAMIAITQA